MPEKVLPYQSPESPTSPSEKAREVFGVIVRTAGIIALLYGLSLLAEGFLEMGFPAELWRVLRLLPGIFLIITAIAMIRGERIVRFAYGRKLR